MLGSACTGSGGALGEHPVVNDPPATPKALEFDPATSKALLFDGKALGRWKATAFPKPGRVTVRDGSIFMQSGHDLTGITWTGPVLRMNYEISLKAKRVAGADFF